MYDEVYVTLHCNQSDVKRLNDMLGLYCAEQPATWNSLDQRGEITLRALRISDT